MNLVEFPFAALSDRSTEQVLEFEVEEFDRERGYPVRRKLTVTGDPKHGLPTAKDEEVYLGLLQLSKLENNFASAVVPFSRGQLLRVMGWKNKDWAYERVTLALQRLTGVRLFYTNAWRDNTNRTWTDKGGFGILDSFRIRDSRLGKRKERDSDNHSEFRWNSVLFESFQSGYLKRLDYLTVLQLGTAAKRLYRYLDKHFHPPKYVRLTFDLRELALEHVGLSRDYDNSQIRRALQPAIEELERIGFIKPVAADERFKQLGRGRWEVSFEQSLSIPRKAQAIRRDATVTVATKNDEQRRFETINRLVARYLQSKSIEEQAAIERDAIEQASPFLRSKLRNDGPLAEECRRTIVRNFVISLVKQEQETRKTAPERKNSPQPS